MEKETAVMVLPWVVLVVGVVTRDSVGPLLAGLIWLPQAFKGEGRQRTFAVSGLLILAAIAALVAWVRLG